MSRLLTIVANYLLLLLSLPSLSIFKVGLVVHLSHIFHKEGQIVIIFKVIFFFVEDKGNRLEGKNLPLLGCLLLSSFSFHLMSF